MNVHDGNPWLFLRENGEAEVRVGASTTVGTSTGNIVTGTNLKIIYDTTQPNWTFTASVVGVEIDMNGSDPGTAYTFSSNPISIKSV